MSFRVSEHRCADADILVYFFHLIAKFIYLKIKLLQQGEEYRNVSWCGELSFQVSGRLGKARSS